MSKEVTVTSPFVVIWGKTEEARIVITKRATAKERSQSPRWSSMELSSIFSRKLAEIFSTIFSEGSDVVRLRQHEQERSVQGFLMKLVL